MLIDSHCHLNSAEMFENAEKHIKDAEEENVRLFVVVGWDKDSSFKALELAKKYKNVYAAVGFHPNDIFNVTEDDFSKTMELLKEDKVVAVGEIGLDYFWEKDLSKKELQREWFKKQILVANAYNKPIILHNREAFEDCLKILKEVPPKVKTVMHCYSGSVEYLKEIIELGLYIGLDGPVTFKNAKTPKEVAKLVPLERLLIETDCPYLTPHPHRGKENTPKYLPLIAKEIANLREIDYEFFEKTIEENTRLFFGI